MFKDHHWKALPSCLEVKKIDDKIGHGLFATKNIPAGCYLGITHVRCDIQQEAITGRRSIRTPVGGFINHSDTPNCALLSHPQERERKGKLGFATHLWTVVPIHKGTELTCFYTDGYEDIIDNWEGPQNLAI